MNTPHPISLPSHWPCLPGLKNSKQQALPVGTIYCIGRNYAEHAREMGSAIPSEPLVFIKPMGSLHVGNGYLDLPQQSNEVHHEVEWVLAIGTGGKNITKEQAWSHVAGWAIGIDFTARDLQKQAKDEGKPWTLSKGFDGFAPVSSFTPRISDLSLKGLTSYEIRLTVNGQERQRDRLGNMLFSAEELIAYLSSVFTLQPGDLIFTGTPSGVSEVISGDHCVAELYDSQGIPSQRLEYTIR